MPETFEILCLCVAALLGACAAIYRMATLQYQHVLRCVVLCARAGVRVFLMRPRRFPFMFGYECLGSNTDEACACATCALIGRAR